jgi:Ca2+-binding RTX toxin-like protein
MEAIMIGDKTLRFDLNRPRLSNDYYGTSGDDYLAVSTTDRFVNRVFAGGGNDYVWASEGRDWVYGEAGNDKIFSYGGNDYLDGGAGADEMVGGFRRRQLRGRGSGRYSPRKSE